MRQSQRSKYPRMFVCSVLGLITLFVLLPLTVLAAHLLTDTNGAFDTPFNNISGRVWNGQNEKIANHWNHFYIDANTYRSGDDAPKLHWMSSAQFASSFGGLDYHIEGDASQMLWSSYEFDAGVYQQKSGLTPGSAYKFFIKMTTYWRGPGYPDTNGVMIKRVGIDPYGGTDPTSSNILWSAPNDNDKSWEGLEVVATAESGTMTLFAKVYAPENNSYNHTDLDMVYFEDARLTYLVDGPTITTLNASAGGTTVNVNWSGNTTSGWALRGYEVQYKDQSAGTWTTLQDKTSQITSGSFSGEAAHTYQIRARTWQTNGTIEVPGRWKETSVIVGNVVMGRVMDHAGIGLDGVTVSISGTLTSTVSANGQYVLSSGIGTFYIVADDFGDLVAPPASSATVPLNGIAAADITLRPDGSNQGLNNNDFETDLASWTVSDGAAAGVSDVEYHTGGGSLHISGTVTVSQTGTITDMQNPLLSFWYNSDTPFTVQFLAKNLGSAGLESSAFDPVSSQTLPATGDWTHVTLDGDFSGMYSGEVGASFSYTGVGANIFVDEVSIAAGPYQTFLPIVMKN